MSKLSVLVLYNQPMLPRDHPDSYSECSVAEIAEEMVTNLAEEGYRARPFPLGSDPTVLWHEFRERRPDVVFNLFEGNLDHPETESYVAGLMDWAGVPFTGSPFPALSLARAKHTAKYLFKGARLPTAEFVVVNQLPMPTCGLKFPVIVKPAKQDASVGVDQASVCVNALEMESRVQYVLATYGGPVLVEEYIAGREFNVALVELPILQSMPPAEIHFRDDIPGAWSILTYAGKWTAGSADYDPRSPTFPADLSKAALRKLDQLALKAYRLLGCRDYARVDFRMNEAGKPFILEVNPNPEISEEAGFVGKVGKAPFTHREFLVNLIEHAHGRKHTPKPTYAPARPEPTAV